jgi:E3 ubiquitin-protein ligase HUWE1
VPLGGFKNLRGLYGASKFSITKAQDTKQLPSASTCFNILKLPDYESKEALKTKLMIAIRNGSEGFAFQ